MGLPSCSHSHTSSRPSAPSVNSLYAPAAEPRRRASCPLYCQLTAVMGSLCRTSDSTSVLAICAAVQVLLFKITVLVCAGLDCVAHQGRVVIGPATAGLATAGPRVAALLATQHAARCRRCRFVTSVILTASGSWASLAMRLRTCALASSLLRSQMMSSPLNVPPASRACSTGTGKQANLGRSHFHSCLVDRYTQSSASHQANIN
jgi:hypothetical protein